MTIENLEELTRGDLIKYIYNHQDDVPDNWKYAVITGLEMPQPGPLTRGLPNRDDRDRITNLYEKNCISLDFNIFFNTDTGYATSHCISNMNVGVPLEKIRLERATVKEVDGLVYGSKKNRALGNPQDTSIELPENPY
ncbi:hypothetical protein GOV12_07195 [Candidatus Pacearchaeota archaeon]|nr:hypothetical protein [Candidatus Pacearchaeota archaeon]